MVRVRTAEHARGIDNEPLINKQLRAADSLEDDFPFASKRGKRSCPGTEIMIPKIAGNDPDTRVAEIVVAPPIWKKRRRVRGKKLFILNLAFVLFNSMLRWLEKQWAPIEELSASPGFQLAGRLLRPSQTGSGHRSQNES
jgi:hypothetical protein